MVNQDLVSALKGIGDAAPKTFLENPIHVKAKEDLLFLCAQTGYFSSYNGDYLTISTSTASVEYGNVLVLGQDLSNKKITFPKTLVSRGASNLHVAVVGYSKGTAVDVYLFPVTGFQKTGLFSMYKEDKKEGTYSIHLPGEKDLKQYSFGYVFNNKIEKGGINNNG